MKNFEAIGLVPFTTSVPETANLVLIAANPRAGARSSRPLVERLAELLRQDGKEAIIESDPERLREAARRGQASGKLRAVVAAGGDGTAAMIANLAPLDTPLVVLPLGTENLLAKYLQISADPAQVARIVSNGATTRLDAGVANGRLFLLMAGCGFDAEVVRRLHQTRTGHIRHLHYLKPIWDSVRSYQYPELRVYCQPLEQETFDPQPVLARWAFVVNLPRYAGGLRLAPQASPTDGVLDVCTFEHGSLWKGLTYLIAVALETQASSADFRWTRATKVRIEAEQSAPYQLDGDPGGSLPVEITAAPGRLRVLIDPQWRPPTGPGEPTANAACPRATCT